MPSTGNGRDYYCGRNVGQAALVGDDDEAADDQCGPSGGAQCALCVAHNKGTMNPGGHESALHLAVRSGSLAALKALLESLTEASAESATKSADKAGIVTPSKGLPDVDVLVPDTNETPYCLANRLGLAEAARALKASGAQPNCALLDQDTHRVQAAAGCRQMDCAGRFVDVHV